MNWKPAILRVWKRREAKLAFFGLLVVVIVQWSFLRSAPEGKVTLEFVGLERAGTNCIQGTIVTFRLRNQSGSAITYVGYSDAVPACAIKPMQKDDHEVSGGNLTNVPNPTSGSGDIYVLKQGEETLVRGEVFVAEQSWRMTLHFWEGAQSSWDRWVPDRIQSKLLGNKPLWEVGMVQSEPVHVLIPPYRNDPERMGWTEYITYPAKTNLNGRVTGKFTRPMFALPKGFEIGEKIDVKQLREKLDNPGN